MIYLHSLLIAVVAVVFSCILIDEEMIFGFYGKWLEKLPEKLAFPLGLCAYCFGGQIALWYYFFLENYRPDNHIFFISVTIFLIHLLKYTYERTIG